MKSTMKRVKSPWKEELEVTWKWSQVSIPSRAEQSRAAPAAKRPSLEKQKEP